MDELCGSASASPEFSCDPRNGRKLYLAVALLGHDMQSDSIAQGASKFRVGGEDQRQALTACCTANKEQTDRV